MLGRIERERAEGDKVIEKWETERGFYEEKG